MPDWKRILNTTVEKTVIDGINFVGDCLDNRKSSPPSSSSLVPLVIRGLTSEGVKLAGREITKDQILKMIGSCTKSGVTGAAIDGALAAHHANKLYKIEKIDRDTFIEYVTKETSCGFVSSSSGSAATIITSLIVGGSGPASVLVGLGTAIGTRYAFRIVVDDALESRLKEEAQPLKEQISFDDLFGSDRNNPDDDEVDIDELLNDSQ